MTCEELLAALNQYVDGELEPGICEPFQEHLKGCNPCQVVVDNIRQTIRLFRAEERYELPPALHRQLSHILRKQWEVKIDEDRSLVAQAKAGDFAAMESLLVKYERQVYALSRRIVAQHQDAEEVTQQTFLSVIEHLPEFREESQFRTWLLRIATNHALALLRKRSLRAGPSIDDRDADESYEGIPHPEFIAVWRDTPEEIAVRQRRGSTSMKRWPISRRNIGWCSCFVTSRSFRLARRPTSWASAWRQSRFGCCGPV